MGAPTYKVISQSTSNSIPMPDYNPSAGYFPGRTDYFGNNGSQMPLNGVPHKLLLQEDDAKLKIRIRVLRVVLRFAATCIAIGTAVQEGLTLTTYLHTRNHIVDGRGPWSLTTQLWTSILLFTASILTVILGFFMILAYLISIRAANKVSSVQTWFAVIVELGHIAVWISVAVAYRAGKNGHDLWGWACSPLAEKIQPNFRGLVDFNRVCSRGESSWRLTIASAAIQVFGGFIWYLVIQRRKTKEALKEIEIGQ